MRPRKGLRGRPEKVWSEHEYDMLEAGLAQGWTNQRLAKALDCGVSTLKRNFGPALRMRDAIPDRLQLALFATAVRKAVEKGDTGAMRQVRAMLDDEKRRQIDADIRASQGKDKVQALGKKEAASQAARELVERGEDAGGWGDLLTPGSAKPH